MQRKLPAKLALLALGLLMAFLITEVLLRVLVYFGKANSSIGFVRFANQQPFNLYHFWVEDRLFRPSDDPDLLWELVPNSRRGPIRINSGGFRGEEVSNVPQPGVTRIAVLGDSETFGEHLPPAQTLPGCLQTKLDAANGKNSRFEILNFGVVGYNTSQEFALLKKRVVNYQPSAVVLYYVFNDPEIYAPIRFAKRTPLAQLYIYQFFEYSTLSLSSINEQRLKAGNMRNYYLWLHSSIYFDAAKLILQEMADYLHQHHIRFFLLIAPEIYDVKDFGPNYPYYSIHNKLKALQSDEMKVVDPLPVMFERFPDPKKLWVTPYDPHKNGEVTCAIAEVLSKQLIQPSNHQ